MNDFMNERLTEDGGAAFAPSRYHLKSKNDAIVQPYRTYDLFYEITFCVMQKLGIYEDIGTPEECRQAMERIGEKEKQRSIPESAVLRIIKELDEQYKSSAYDPDYYYAIADFEERFNQIIADNEKGESSRMNSNLSINTFIKEVGKNNDRHGFRTVNTKPTDFVALIHSEVSEVLEEFRSGHEATETYYRESDGKPEGVPAELADIVIRCFDMADYYSIDLEAAILEKHEFNKSRPYLHGKKF